MHKDFSPEEKLLRLIRSKASREAAPASTPEVPGGPALKAAPSTSKVPIRQKFSLDVSGFFQWKNLNLALIVLVAALAAYSVPFFLKRPKDILGNMEEKVKNQEKAPGQKSEGFKRPPFEHFSEAIGARNIFSPVLKEEAQGPAAAEQGPKLEDVKGQLNLLGVVSGESPQAIIEDKRTQKSYFLNKGSTFDDIEVKDILENKVILIYRGQEFELVL